jgi:SAM-dependent methyltransferase
MSNERHLTLEEVQQRHGPWTAMSIHLGDGRYTLQPPVADWRLRRFVQLVADLLGKPLAQARVLDLACLEGHYAIEFALHGADVTAIEIREANIEKARYAKQQMGLERLTLVQDDVRNVSLEKYGPFDVIICAGFIYHLDVPDVFHTMERLAQMCSRLTIIESQMSMKDQDRVEYQGQTYWGLWYQEHAPEASEEDKLADRWASVDNVRSFWFTPASMLNLVSQVGFSSCFECHNPVMPQVGDDRRTYVAMKGPRQRVLSSPPTDALVDVPRPEHNPNPLNTIHIEHGAAFRFLKNAMPQGLKDVVKPVLRGVGVLPPDETPPWLKNRKNGGS